jgi:hypothetical protein
MKNLLLSILVLIVSTSNGYAFWDATNWQQNIRAYGCGEARARSAAKQQAQQYGNRCGAEGGVAKVTLDPRPMCTPPDPGNLHCQFGDCTAYGKVTCTFSAPPPAPPGSPYSEYKALFESGALPSANALDGTAWKGMTANIHTPSQIIEKRFLMSFEKWQTGHYVMHASATEAQVAQVFSKGLEYLREVILLSAAKVYEIPDPRANKALYYPKYFSVVESEQDRSLVHSTPLILPKEGVKVACPTTLFIREIAQEEQSKLLVRVDRLTTPGTSCESLGGLAYIVLSKF